MGSSLPAARGRRWLIAGALLLPGASLLPPGAAVAADVAVGGPAISVPDGFVVEQVAGPPLVERPVAVAFDADGRLYVTESSGSNAPLVEQQTDPRHRVLQLRDADGDGRYDDRSVFADGLMMPQGCLWHRGSVYVAAPPQILRLTDTDDDGVADSRVVWHDGGTLTGCGNDLHGPALGPDGRLYFTKGAFAKQSYDLPGRPGWTTRASHLFRARLDGTDLEPVLTGGMDNPVDVAFRSDGEPLLSATFLQRPAAGRRDGVVHAVYGGVYGKQHGVLDDHPRTGELLPVLAHLGPAAACGLHVHSGYGLGAEFRDDAFVCQFNLRSVIRLRLERSGATFAARAEPFLAVDAVDFHPTDVIEDADGSLLVVDTGGWYKLCCPTSQLEKPAVLGGIYRVRREDTAPTPDPRGLAISWEALGVAELASLLADDRPAVVARAIERLEDAGPAAIAPAAALLGGEPGSTAAARLAAARLLTRLETPASQAALRRALNDPAVEVRQAAAHAAGLHRDAEAVDGLVTMAVGDEPGPARVAAEALGRIAGQRAVSGLLQACRRDADRMLEHALIYGLIEAGTPELLRESLESDMTRVRRRALIAADQLPLQQRRPASRADALLRGPLIAACRDPDPALRDTALWLISRHPEWADSLAADVPAILSRIAESRAGRAFRAGPGDRLLDRLARLATRPAIAEAIAAVCAEAPAPSPAITAAALDVMAAARVSAVPDSWVAALRKIVEATAARSAVPAGGPGDRGEGTEAVFTAALETLVSLPLSESQRGRVRPILWTLAADPRLPTPECLRAIAAADSPKTVPDAVLRRLIAVLATGLDPADPGDRGSPLDRTAAATTLAAAAVPDTLWTAVATMFDRLPGSEVAVLLPAVSNRGGRPLTIAIERLATRSRFAAVPRGVLEAAVAAVPAELKPRGESLLARFDAARRSSRQTFLRFAASLPEGDASRGHAVFYSNKAACTTCHALAYAGGRVGPDLTGIGRIRSPADLLEAIVLPSASFVRSYEPVSVLTVDGKLLTGIIRDETAAELVLQTSATATERIPREAVEDLAAGTVSIMPNGYDKLLSPQELADLVAFLAATK